MVSGCGSSRPVPATRREFPTNNLLLTPCKGCSKCEHAGQQSAGQGRTEPRGAGQGGRAGRAGRAGQGLQGAGRKAQGAGQRLWGQRAGTKEGGGQGVGQGRAGQRADREALIVLLRRSAGGLGRSFERPCKWSAEPSAV